MSDYPETAAAPSQIGGQEVGYAVEKLAASRRLRVPTVREQVADRILGLEKQLADHKAVLQILDGTPDLEKALDALRRIGV